jgi:hypothetical protein
MGSGWPVCSRGDRARRRCLGGTCCSLGRSFWPSIFLYYLSLFICLFFLPEIDYIDQGRTLSHTMSVLSFVCRSPSHESPSTYSK